jgi:GTP diphosphokinase / guanosine-3',5'-bis(diphosphate) 3'-diphosphatase
LAVIRIGEIIDRLTDYHQDANLAVVQKAYVWSAKLHHGARRMDGMPYLSHPLEVAGILTELKLHERAIAAGLLHDVIEDSSLTIEELEEVFGKEIARLVDGVTKLGRLTKENSQAEFYSSNYRKMFLAMAQDVRVILIKLADRLHNMRTLSFLAEHKRVRIAQETLDIYAPIASRLGIHWIQAQLEDLSFQYLYPEMYERLSSYIIETRELRQEYIEKSKLTIQEKLLETDIESAVSGRFKHIYSIYTKMNAQQLSFEEVHDIIAFRIIVSTIPECYDALRVIHSIWRPVPGKIKDYIALPKPNMYRSLHTTVIGIDGERIEIQIRTNEMHALAEYGIAAHWRYKEEGTGSPEEVDEQRALEFVKNLVEIDEDIKNPYRFLDSIKNEILSGDIVVFTPEGDTIELPPGSTPIDFAYVIHSDIGNHTGGAKINGRIVPISHTLKAGDTVEIITSNSVEPERAWLDIAKSQKALNRINNWITIRENMNLKELGRQILEAELIKNGQSLTRMRKDGTLKKVVKRFSFQNEDKLLEALGSEKISVLKVLRASFPKDKNLKSNRATKPKKDKSKSASQIIEEGETSFDEISQVDAIENLNVEISSYHDPGLIIGDCCSPLFGDEVAGLRDEDGHMVIHRFGCDELTTADHEGIIKATWENNVEGEGQTTIEIISEDVKGMLAKLTTTISDLNFDIIRAVAHTTEKKKAIHSFCVKLKGLSDLQQLIKAIEKIDGTISVKRF